jgi:hypothetical protein
MSAAPPSPSPWGQFTVDPRRPEAAGLRASDRDRDVVLGVLAEGYAEGRLTREEYDERATSATGAKTLGELPEMIRDLVPDRPTAAPDVPDRADLHRQALQRWAAQRRRALTGFVIPTVICWAIWVMTGLHEDGFHRPWPWPLFVMLGTAAGLARVLMNKQAIVADHERRLEKRQRRRDAPTE